VLYFSTVAIFLALVERFAFLDYANGLQDVGYFFGLNNDCLALCLASPSNGSQFVLGKPFANVALSETCFPLFTVGVRCPCCQEQRRDTGYKYSVHRGAFFLSGTFLMKRHTGALGHRLQHCSDQSIWNPLGVCGTDSLAQARVSV